MLLASREPDQLVEQPATSYQHHFLGWASQAASGPCEDVPRPWAAQAPSRRGHSGGSWPWREPELGPQARPAVHSANGHFCVAMSVKGEESKDFEEAKKLKSKSISGVIKMFALNAPGQGPCQGRRDPRGARRGRRT